MNTFGKWSITSFFYDVILHCRPLYVQNDLSFAYLWQVLGEFDPLNVVGIRADPKKVRGRLTIVKSDSLCVKIRT